MRIEGNRDRHVAVVVYVTVMLICVGLPVCLVTRATTSLKIFVGRVGATLFLCVTTAGRSLKRQTLSFLMASNISKQIDLDI